MIHCHCYLLSLRGVLHAGRQGCSLPFVPGEVEAYANEQTRRWRDNENAGIMGNGKRK